MEVKKYKGLHFNNNKFTNVNDDVSIEVALSIAVNHVPFTVTMQTPGNEFDLARGLLFTENVFSSLDVKPGFEVLSYNENGYIESINVSIPADAVVKDFSGNRNVMSVSSCGICGKTTLDDLHCKPVESAVQLDAEVVANMFSQINNVQHNFKKTGGTHAAGAFTIDGEVLSIQEDIGRHNAVDKVIGNLINLNKLSQARIITVSGRVSFEIISKARVAGIPFVAAVSAPSSLAIEYAEQSGITLLAFCRNDGFTAYSNFNKIKSSAPEKVLK